MAWIRLSDDYNDHPKFTCLSDGAFRLWHQGMGFCRKFKTDGRIPTVTLRAFSAFTAKRMTELLTPWQANEQPLWHPVDGFGINVHDYLDWNLSRNEEDERRTDSRDQMRAIRKIRREQRVSTNTSLTSSQQPTNVSAMLGDGMGSDQIKKKKSVEDLLARAGRLREELYPEWYAKCRNGARLRIIANRLEFDDALSLVRQWDDARLEKLAKIVLTTDDDWIARTDRGFKIFALKASWADDRLRQVEGPSA